MELTPDGHAGRSSGSPTGMTVRKPSVNCSTNPGDASSAALILRVGCATTSQFCVSFRNNATKTLMTIINTGKGLHTYNPPEHGPQNLVFTKKYPQVGVYFMITHAVVIRPQTSREGRKVLRKVFVHHIVAVRSPSCTTSHRRVLTCF